MEVKLLRDDKVIPFQLYDWATRPQAHKDRLLTFYRMCDRLVRLHDNRLNIVGRNAS